MNDRRLGLGLEEVFGGDRCPDVRYRVLQSWRRGRVRRAAARTARWGVAAAGILVVVLATLLGPSSGVDAETTHGQDPLRRSDFERRFEPRSAEELAAFLGRVQRVEAEALALGGVAVRLAEGRASRVTLPENLATAVAAGFDLNSEGWVSAHLPTRGRLILHDDQGRALSVWIAHDGRFAIDGLGGGSIQGVQPQLGAFLDGLERRAERELGAFRRALHLQEWRDGRAELPAWLPLGQRGEMLTAMAGVQRVRRLDTSRAAWLDAAEVRELVARWQPEELRLRLGQTGHELWPVVQGNPPLKRFEVRYEHPFQANLPVMGIGRRRCADCHKPGAKIPLPVAPSVDWGALTGVQDVHLEALSLDESHVVGMRSVPRLRILRLWGCDLDGLGNGEALGRLFMLEHLSLRGSVAVAPLLPTLRGLRQLRVLDLRETDLSDAQIVALRAALPKTQVWRY